MRVWCYIHIHLCMIFPSYVHSSMGTKKCENRFWNLQVQATSRFRNNLPLILREYWSEKTCIFQVRTDKVPIEEMTDRWETGNSDGWQSMYCFAIRFLHLRGRIPPSKKQQTSEIYKACFDISQRVQHFFTVTQRNKNPQFIICHRPADLPAIRQTCMRAI